MKIQRQTALRRLTQGGTFLPPDELAGWLPSGWPIGVPLVRIWTCGLLAIEVLREVRYDPDGHLVLVYEAPAKHQMQRKGSTTALNLLKLLASQPGRFSTKDWLLEKLHRSRGDQEELGGLTRFDNVVSLLRGLLCPQGMPGEDQVRKVLVEWISSTPESGTGYRLACFPLIWVDVDAMAAHVRMAQECEAVGQDAFPSWHEAYEIGKRGPFLAEAQYSDWATGKRAEIEGSLWQCVQALWRLYVARHGERGEEEALRLLQEYWLWHSDNEQAFLPLVTILGQRKEYQLAEKYYEMLCEVLKQAERHPTPRIEEAMIFLRTQQLQGEHSPYRIEVRPHTSDELSLQAVEGGSMPLVHTLTPLPHPAALPQSFLPRFWDVPYQRNPFFTGRDDVLTRLHEMLTREHPVVAVQQHALCGLGGIGKTQTVLEYIYRYESEYQAVFWIKADTRENLFADFLSLAQLLTLPERDSLDQAVVTAAIQRWLQEHTGWLLVFDNADDLEMVQEVLPRACHGHVLLTTRAKATGGLAHSIVIEVMSQDIGALLLLRRVGIIRLDEGLSDTTEMNRAFAQEIVLELGGLPLALDQAGAYIEETSSSLQEYIQLYRRGRYALLKRRGGLTIDHPEPVAATWALSFRRIEQRDQLAADLLRLFAFLDPDGIPEEIMRAYTVNVVVFTPEKEDGWEYFRANEALEVLLRFSLIQRCTENKTVMIHRLVQAAIQDSMGASEQHTWRENVTQIVRLTFPHTSTMYSTLGHPYYAVQLLRVSMYEDQASGNKEDLAAEHWKLAVQQQVIGKLKASEHSLLAGLSLCKEIDDHLNEAKTHQYLALLRAYQGIFPASFHHLKIAASLLRERQAIDVQCALHAYQALCSLLADDIQGAFLTAQCAWQQAQLLKNDRDMIRAQWLLGNILVRLSLQSTERDEQNMHLQQAKTYIEDALQCCQYNHIVDYEADLLLAWARLHVARGNDAQALESATEALVIAERSTFRLLSADIHMILSHIALGRNDYRNAKMHAHAAFNNALCDSEPYWYHPTATEAKRLLNDIK